jgi:hypothetical protein
MVKVLLEERGKSLCLRCGQGGSCLRPEDRSVVRADLPVREVAHLNPQHVLKADLSGIQSIGVRMSWTAMGCGLQAIMVSGVSLEDGVRVVEAFRTHEADLRQAQSRHRAVD